MKGWLIYDRVQYEKNAWFADEIIKYCSAFSDIELIIAEELSFGTAGGSISFSVGGVVKPAPGYAVCRTIFPLLSYTLEQDGVRVFNRYAISAICNDKRYTVATVAKAGVPIADTLFCGSRSAAGPTRGFDYPHVIKSVDGHGGAEVFLVNGEDEKKAAINAIFPKDHLEQKVCGERGRDLRVYVLGGEILYAVMRSSDGFKSNYSLGGKAEAYTLGEDEKRAVNAILKALPVTPDFVGVDFIPDGGKLVFNEIEDVVGSRMLYRVYGLDVARLFADHIKRSL